MGQIDNVFEKVKLKRSKRELLLLFILLMILLIYISLLINVISGIEKILDDTFGLGTYDEIKNFNDVYFFPLLFYLLLTFSLLQIWRRFLRRSINKMPPTTLNLIYVLGRMLIFSFGVVSYLNSFPEFSGLLLGFSAIIGTAIGFASTTSMSNFIAGLYILISRPFAVGDYIIIPGMNMEGVVREITINYTRIKLPTGNRASIVNGSLINQSIINTNIGKQKKIKNGKQQMVTIYQYAQNWNVRNEWSHKAVIGSIEYAANIYSEQLIKPISWSVIKQENIGRIYEIIFVTDKAELLLTIVPEFLTVVSARFEDIITSIKT